MFSQKRVFEIIEKGQADDRASRYCDLFLFSLIVLNLLAVCLETIDSLYAQYRTVFTLIELISVSIFSIEILDGIYFTFTFLVKRFNSANFIPAV